MIDDGDRGTADWPHRLGETEGDPASFLHPAPGRRSRV
jgi:hypothetical protein